MHPIYEQGRGKGHGFEVVDFLNRFKAICTELLETQRAKAFAFILYDFEDKAIREVLKDRGGFVELDRLSGTDLSVFYLDEPNRPYVKPFNDGFLKLLGVAEEARTPCVVFFRFQNGGISETTVANIRGDHIITSFHELYTVLGTFTENADAPRPKVLQLFRGAVKFVSAEALGAFIEMQIGALAGRI